MPHTARTVSLSLVLLTAVLARPADGAPSSQRWATLGKDSGRGGFAFGNLKGPGAVAWAVCFDGERIGTAVEPIVADGRVFVPTHAGGVWALDAETGKPLWRFGAAGPVLHSPAHHVLDVSKRRDLYVADAAGVVYALDPATGKPRWACPLPGESFAASPTAFWVHRFTDLVVIGSRSGSVFGIDGETGKVHWHTPVGAPVRQTAAASSTVAGPTGVYLVAEDLRLRSFDTWLGRVEWTSVPLPGQSARDYYPVIRLWSGDEPDAVFVRTSPRTPFSRRLAADLKVLCGSAGVDASGWKPIDAWTKDTARNLGTPDLWENERAAVLAHLKADPDAATFLAFDAGTGRPLPTPPVLWAGGCQGVPAPPALTLRPEGDYPANGPPVVEYRTAYGNWNHGVAPLVGIGIYDPVKNVVGHVNHANGTPNAPWNTYWGTADEAKHFQVVGDAVVITHQATLCLFDLKTNKLTTLQGDRDTFGGYPGLPWARNEWHGPARGGAAVVGDSLFWVSGSHVFRVDCRGERKPNPPAVALRAADVPAVSAERVRVVEGDVKSALDRQVAELMSRPWAPFACVPGLAGPERAFAHSGEVVEALAWAYPHLPADRRAQVKAYVDAVLAAHPPLDPARMTFDPADGDRREDVPPAAEATKPRGDDVKLHPFGNVAVMKLWADRTPDPRLLEASWPAMKANFVAFERAGWSLDLAKGHLHANRYLAALLAYAEVARARQDPSADRAAKLADDTAKALAAWWRQAAAEQRAMAGVDGVAKLDQFIGRGGGVFLAVAPHRHKLALFKDLTPAALAAVRRYEPDAPARAWAAFVAVAPTWYLVGEERQVHTGENLYDPPDFSMDAFRAAKWVGGERERLLRYADQPWGKADVYFIQKAAMALE